MSLISYIKQLWDTTSFVNPTRLNHMEDGIKSACDGVDAISKDATTTEAGLMSASDKAKLDGIESGATASSGTITGITMNGASKGTSGVVNLGTVVTDVSGKQDTVDNSLGTSAKTIVGAINEVNTGLAGKSDTSHNHDSRYYTKSEIDTKLSNIGSTHNHDDRYYTESEINSKLSEKANVIGSAIRISNTTSISSSKTRTVILESSSLPQGTYIFSAYACFQSTSTVGTRAMNLVINNGEYSSEEVGANSGGYTTLNASGMFTSSGDGRTIKVQVCQNSGSSITTSAYLWYIRLA